MPTISVTDGPQFEAEATTRLVIALEDNGVDILHRCGGNAKCTTCRVTFEAGESNKMTEAEQERLGENLGEFRLSCQILCEQDMRVTPIYRLSESEMDDAGPRPADHITPEPVWTET
ncbi:MAG: (2Fe-2S)-binding protein [Chloroflexi bacterium]|nr:(2Fe-2S)-binding protein [Chloroflexota bacterium]